MIWERTYPFTLGVIAFAGWIAFGHQLAELAGLRMWAFEKIFESMFGFISITTGFLAGFYGTIQSITEGFIQDIRKSPAFEMLLVYAKHGIIIGFVFAIYTVPFMIIQPLPLVQFSIENGFVASWCALCATSLSMFWRVAQHLFGLFETKVDRPNPGG
ncbi:MAG TPA: hypothetical protein VK196_02695 [Magnetospirillum sp.]|nr:hypothetical protein [Magnetospirillum sp.]